MALRVSRGARVHAVAFAQVVSGSRSGRADKNDHDQQQYPSLLRHTRYTFSAMAVFRYAQTAHYLKTGIRSADFKARIASLCPRAANGVEPARRTSRRVGARILNDA
jgi:hypothetical protein